MECFLFCTLAFMVGLSLQGGTVTGATIKHCPPKEFSYNKYCYKFFSLKMRWIEAEKTCQDYMPGTHLASVNNDPENSKVAMYVLDNHNYFENIWIGLYRISTSKSENLNWFWSDGSSSGSHFWDEGEPNNVNNQSTCTEMLHESGFYYWNDADCELKRYFLCKYKL